MQINSLITQKNNTETSKTNFRARRKEKIQFDSQGVVNVKEVKGGIICCADGLYVKILEVLPLNFYKKDVSERNQITDSFSRFWKTCPDNIHIKVRTEKSDSRTIIDTIRKNCAKIKNPKLTEQAERYIEHIQMLEQLNTFDKRYYVIFQYEGDGDAYSRDFKEIYRTMRSTELDLRSKLINCGNIVIVPDDLNYHALEVLYKFYNPLSSINENLMSRITRINFDYMTVRRPYGKPMEADYIAPKGLISRATKDWLLMDGMYHTWLVIRDNAYPGAAQTGWIDNIPVSYGVDVDFVVKRVSRTIVDNALQQMNKFSFSTLNNTNRPDKIERSAEKLRNANYIRDAFNAGDEDLFNVEIIITVRSETFAGMKDTANHIKKHLQGFSIYTTPSFLTAHEFLKNVAPDMYITKSFHRKFAHNFLTRNMAQLYNFTSMSLWDNEGFVIGTNVDGGSLISFNNYNTKLYSNANAVILGPSGSGKSFLEMMLGYRMCFMGIRTMFILPLKAHEYYNACQSIGGQYIRFIPGGRDCVNIMEIRPQVNPDGSLMGEDDDSDDPLGSVGAPLLSKKIASLCTWLQLNMLGEDKLTTTEKNRFNLLCTRLYANYNITTDNDSIWKDKKARKLRPMPILQDLNDALREDPMFERIKDVLSPYMPGGIFENFNGPTNVDLSSQFIVFDVDKSIIGEDYLPSMMYIASDCSYDLAKQSLDTKDAIFMDEVWLMTQNKDCAKQVKEMVKIIRGYGGCTILSSQNIEDFLNSSDGFGKSIIASSNIKFILKPDNDDEVEAIASVVDFNENDIETWKKFPPHGRSFLVSGKDKLLVDLIASDEETLIFTTDVNIRKKKKKQSMNK